MNPDLLDNSYYNNVNLLLLIPLLLLFFIFSINPDKTKKMFKCFFSNAYFYTYQNDTFSKLSIYQVLVFMFSSFVFTFFLVIVKYDKHVTFHYFSECFNTIIYFNIIYFSLKYIFSECLYRFSSKKVFFKQILLVESCYLVTILLFLFFVLAHAFLYLNHYDFVRHYILLLFFVLYSIRVVYLLVNNKNLLFGKVLHIILYLCTLEIIPFIYLFKSYIE